jgi:hypothetical protein
MMKTKASQEHYCSSLLSLHSLFQWDSLLNKDQPFLPHNLHSYKNVLSSLFIASQPSFFRRLGATLSSFTYLWMLR